MDILQGGNNNIHGTDGIASVTEPQATPVGPTNKAAVLNYVPVSSTYRLNQSLAADLSTTPEHQSLPMES